MVLIKICNLVKYRRIFLTDEPREMSGDENELLSGQELL